VIRQYAVFLCVIRHYITRFSPTPAVVECRVERSVPSQFVSMYYVCVCLLFVPCTDQTAGDISTKFGSGRYALGDSYISIHSEGQKSKFKVTWSKNVKFHLSFIGEGKHLYRVPCVGAVA